MPPLRTVRLDLVPATPDLARAQLESNAALERALGATVPEAWPPLFFDAEAVAYALDRLEAGPEQAGWWFYHAVLRADCGEPPTLVGTAGFKGPPDAQGVVEIGYSVLDDYQRRGLATEAVHALVAHAFALPGVRRVVAETLPHLVGSIGVLEKNGFVREGPGAEPGVIRFLRNPDGFTLAPPR